MRRLTAITALAIVVLVAGGAAAADTFAVTLVSETNTTITLGWQPQPGFGYLFSADGALVSRTNDPSRSSVKFSKQYSSFDIDVIVKGANGHYPTNVPVPDPPTATFTINPSSAVTGQNVTFDWTGTCAAGGCNLVWEDEGSDGPGGTDFPLGTGDPFIKSFVTVGTKYVHLVVTDTLGRSAESRQQLVVAATPLPPAECSDGIDNDGNGKIDYPADPGCTSATDTDESGTTPPPGGDQFPNPATTGTPPGWTPQTTSSSSVTLSQNGQVFQDVRLTNGADITVTGQNVTIRRVELDGGTINNQPGNSCGNGLLIEDTSILPTSPGAGVQDSEGVIAYGGYTARRVEINGRSEGFRVSGASSGCGPVAVEDSFERIVPPTPCGDWHGDGLQGYNGSAVTISNVTVDQRTSGCYGTAPFFYPRNQGNTGPVNVSRFLVMGQGYSFRLGEAGSVAGLKIVDGSWVFGPVDINCSALSSYEAKIVTIDSDYKVTSTVRDAPCTGSGT